MDVERAIFEFELAADDAHALAQMLKRIGWSEIRALAASDAEADEMRNALDVLRKTMAGAGYEPR